MSLSKKNSQLRRWAGALLLLITALLYLFTLDNGLRPDELTGGDLITHQYAQVEARPSNAPGYPLYTMGGWLWFRAGQFLLDWLLNPIQILSAYSMLWGLASLAILYLILLKVFDRWLPAVLLTAFHATTFFFWYYSVTTEQYTSAVFQTLLLIWLAFAWDDSPRDILLLAMAFVSGTMLANMVTTLFILPPLLWFIFAKQSSAGPMLVVYLKRSRLILQAVGVTALPLFSYVYIYIRGAQHPEWRGEGQWPTAWAWFVEFITIQQGRDELAPGLGLQNIFTDEFPLLMIQELTWLVFFGGLLGVAFLGRRRAIFLYSTLIIYLLFCWSYRFGNWFQVIIPAYPIFTIGFAAILHKLSSLTNQQRPFIIHNSSFIILVLASLFIYRVTTNYPQANQRNLATDTGLDPGWAILTDAPTPPALVSSSFAEKVALTYLDKVWNVTPEMILTNPGELEPPPTTDLAVINRYVTRQAINVAPDMIQLDQMTPQAAGLQLIALADTSPTQLPPTARPLDLAFGESLHLIGWERVGTSMWQLALYWQTSAPLTHDYTISMRPLVADQLIIVDSEALIQDHQPVWGIYPTSQWPVGVIVRDVYALPLPVEVEPEAMQIVVYRAIDGGFENLAEHVIPLEDKK